MAVKNRTVFEYPKDQSYFCTHGLGLLSKPSKAALQNALDAWRKRGVLAWGDSWGGLAGFVRARIATLLGANTCEVGVCDTTTLNLIKVLNASLDLQPRRRVILTEQCNFPSDLYALQSVAKARNLELRCVAREQLMESIDETVAVLALTHVNYLDAFKTPMKSLNARARHMGVLNVWDLSHSVGAMRISCEDDGVDFAVGATYKYVCGGPGSPEPCEDPAGAALQPHRSLQRRPAELHTRGTRALRLLGVM